MEALRSVPVPAPWRSVPPPSIRGRRTGSRPGVRRVPRAGRTGYVNAVGGVADTAGGVEDPHQQGAEVSSRRSILVGGAAVAATAPTSALAATLLSERLERKELSKPVFNKQRPGPQEYPPWLEGTWTATASFQGYQFPSKTLNNKLLVKEPTVPGFQKLSVVYVPDIGSENVRYLVRFVQPEGGGPVYEDRAFNLAAVVNGYLGKEAVQVVEYDRAVDPNRTTIRLKQGASNNAERIELFCNARESETRPSDGTFFAAEAMRQVTLGYGREYNQARVVNTDYEHIWTFTPLYDEGEGGGMGDATRAGDTYGEEGKGSRTGGVVPSPAGGEGVVRQPQRVRVTLSTAGYVQPTDALRLTAAPQISGGAPVPQMGFAGTAAFEPAVLYSHSIMLERSASS